MLGLSSKNLFYLCSFDGFKEGHEHEALNGGATTSIQEDCDLQTSSKNIHYSTNESYKTYQECTGNLCETKTNSYTDKLKLIFLTLTGQDSGLKIPTMSSKEFCQLHGGDYSVKLESNLGSGLSMITRCIDNFESLNCVRSIYNQSSEELSPEFSSDLTGNQVTLKGFTPSGINNVTFASFSSEKSGATKLIDHDYSNATFISQKVLNNSTYLDSVIASTTKLALLSLCGYGVYQGLSLAKESVNRTHHSFKAAGIIAGSTMALASFLAGLTIINK
jgi:hypothetical protein